MVRFPVQLAKFQSCCAAQVTCHMVSNYHGMNATAVGPCNPCSCLSPLMLVCRPPPRSRAHELVGQQLTHVCTSLTKMDHGLLWNYYNYHGSTMVCHDYSKYSEPTIIVLWLTMVLLWFLCSNMVLPWYFMITLPLRKSTITTTFQSWFQVNQP